MYGPASGADDGAEQTGDTAGRLDFVFFKQKTAYEITRSLEFRRVLFRSVAERQRTRPTTGSAPGATPVGRRQPGDRCRPGVAQSKLKKNKTKPLRSDFFPVMLRLWGKRGATAGRRSAASSWPS